MDIKNASLNFLILFVTAFFAYLLAYRINLGNPGIVALLPYIIITIPPLAGLLYMGSQVRSDTLIYLQGASILSVVWAVFIFSGI